MKITKRQLIRLIREVSGATLNINYGPDGLYTYSIRGKEIEPPYDAEGYAPWDDVENGGIHTEVLVDWAHSIGATAINHVEIGEGVLDLSTFSTTWDAQNSPW